MSWQDYWDFRSAFADIMDERYHTLAWLDRQVLEGNVRLWRSDNAAMLTEIKDYPTGAKDIHVVISAGDIDEITDVLRPQAEEYGRGMGCIAATVESRVGWAKVLRPFGYETHQLTVRKEL